MPTHYYSSLSPYFTMGDDGKCYWEDGSITEGLPMTTMMEMNHEDYSAWSDERRAQVKEEFRVKREEYASMRAAHCRWRAENVESARAKLTEDEFEAMLDEGRGY